MASEFVAHVGPAVQVELVPWLSLRGDLRGTVGDETRGVRAMLGAVIPIRRHRADDSPTASAPATTIPNPTPKAAGLTPPPAAWLRVKPGREVWVTTNAGSPVHGEIAAISSSTLVLRQQSREVTINLDDVRLVEGRDSLKNGFLIGGGSGAVAGGVLFGLLSSVYCGSGSDQSDDCNVAGIIVVGAASGAVVSGFIGAMVDSLIPGRQTLFRGSTTVVTPVITPTKKAINVAIGWR